MDKLYIVKQTKLSVIHKIPKDDISEKVDNIKIFKKREKAVKLIDELFNRWSKVGTFYDGVEITKKERISDAIACVCYLAHGIYETIDIVEQYIIEEIDYDE